MLPNGPRSNRFVVALRWGGVAVLVLALSPRGAWARGFGSACCSPSGGCISVGDGQPCPAGTSGPIDTHGQGCGPAGLCDSSGACCLSDGTCIPLFGITTCNNIQGTFLGGGSSCLPANICVKGTCCSNSTGACGFTPQATCPSGGNTWTTGGTCNPTPCPPGGACCLSTGECRQVIQLVCGPGVPWTSGGTCTPTNPCPQPGTCCVISTGACSLKLQSACGAGSVWQGNASCSASPCTGACCNRWTGACVVINPGTCNNLGLRYMGVGTTCSPATCKRCPADFDGVGGATIDDIFVFLNAWFAGCP